MAIPKTVGQIIQSAPTRLANAVAFWYDMYRKNTNSIGTIENLKADVRSGVFENLPGVGKLSMLQIRRMLEI